MPYDIWHPRGGKYEVHKRGEAHNFGSHDTRDEAVKQIQAIYANEQREKK